MELAQRMDNSPPDIAGMPHIGGTIRPGCSSVDRSVTSAVESASTLTSVVGTSRMSTGPTGSERTDQNEGFSDRSGRIGSDRIGSDRIGSGLIGSGPGPDISPFALKSRVIPT